MYLSRFSKSIILKSSHAEIKLTNTSGLSLLGFPMKKSIIIFFVASEIVSLYVDINFIYKDVIHRIKRHHIKCINNMNKPLILISSAYPGVWL